MFVRSSSALRRTAAVVPVIALIALGGAGIAGAQTPPTSDQDFLNQMQGEGITFTSPEAGVALARHICEEFDSGVGVDAVVAEGQQNSSLTDYQVGYVIGGSVAVYCPEHADQIPS
ncbi:DUF732 domain-containing protein [Streptomyces sp. NPDC058171]